jgi:hypothetical protein
VESDPNPDPSGGSTGSSTEATGTGARAAETEDETTGESTGNGTGDDDGRDPLRFSNWMKRSATGAVLTGVAFGLKEALQPKREEIPFVIEAPGEPEDPDKPFDLHFDPESPADTVAIIRRPGGAEPPAPPAQST